MEEIIKGVGPILKWVIAGVAGFFYLVMAIAPAFDGKEKNNEEKSDD